MLAVLKIGLAFRMVRVRMLVRGSKTELEVLLNAAGGDMGGLRKDLARLLDSRRKMAAMMASIRESVLDVMGRKGLLVSVILQLMDDTLESVDDQIETLELSVDQEVREHLAREIRQIAASG